MDDITARILVVTEATAAQQGIKNTTKSMKELTEARLKDLEIAQKKAKIELLAHEAEKANAQVSFLEKKVKNSKIYLDVLKQYGARADEMARATKKLEEFTSSLLEAKLKTSGLNLDLGVQQEKLRDLEKNAKKGAKALDEMTKKTVLARIASRMFHMDLGSGVNPRMLQAGIIAAGAASAVKLLSFAYNETRKSLREQIDLQNSNRESLQEALEFRKKQIDQQESLLGSLSAMHEKTEMSSVDMLNYSKVIKKLAGTFEQLGVKIDSATGGMKNFSIVSAKLKQKNIDDEIRTLKAQLKQNSETKKTLEEQRETAGLSGWWLLGLPQLLKWDRGTRIGGADEVKKSMKETEKIDKENMKIMQRLQELRRLTPEKDAKEMQAAKETDAAHKIQKEVNAIDNRILHQTKLNKILEREVEIGKLKAKLDERRKVMFATLGGKNKDFYAIDNRKRQQLMTNTPSAFNEIHKEVKAIENEIQRQKNLNDNLKREVEIKKIKERLDERRRGMTIYEAKAFDANRKAIEARLIAEYDINKQAERRREANRDAERLEKQRLAAITQAAKKAKAFSLERQIVYSAENRRASTRLGGEFGAMASWRAMMSQQQQQRDQKELPKNVTKATNLLEKISISLDRLKETGLMITYS